MIDADTADFVDYLVNTLIPDLQDGGRIETAKDFQTAVDIIYNLDTRLTRCLDDITSDPA